MLYFFVLEAIVTQEEADESPYADIGMPIDKLKAGTKLPKITCNSLWNWCKNFIYGENH